MLLLTASTPARAWKCPQTITYPSCGLWQSPSDDVEVIDQSQLDDSRPLGSSPKLGQTFVIGGAGPQALYRIDVEFHNSRDERPATLRVFRWRGSYTSTVAEVPRFTDVFDMTGREKYQIRSFYPRLEVEGGETYLMELDFTGREASVIPGSTSASAYPDGAAYVGTDYPQPYDIWFRTYKSPVRPATPPAFAASDPSLAWTPPKPEAPVTKESYYDRVKAWAELDHCQAISGCGEASATGAFLRAFLHRTCGAHGTCGDKDVAEVVAMLERLNRWYRCSPSRSDDCAKRPCPDCKANAAFFAWMEKPGLAYLWIKDDKSITADDRSMIRDLFVTAARDFWPQREAGAMNRSMLGALTYLLVTTAFPPDDVSGQPSIAEWNDWRAYADCVWNDFWSHRDSEEDSGHYSENVFVVAMLEYAMVAGLDAAVWSDPQFLSWVDRYYQHVTTLGVTPNYGDGAGWDDEHSGLVWLFEKAAAKTGATKYKWLARKIFASKVARVCDNPPRDDSFRLAFSGLVGAYLDANDAIADTRPNAQSEFMAAAQERPPNGAFAATPTAPVGQTFKLTASPLVRLDLWVASNNGDVTPATITIRPWAGSYAKTVAQVPLYVDTIDMTEGSREVSLFPFLPIADLSQVYFLEVSRPVSGFSLKGTRGGDPYAGGAIRVGGSLSTASDLWFKTYSLTGDGSMVSIRRLATLRSEGKLTSLPNCSSTRNPADVPKKYLDLDGSTPPVMVPDKLILRSGYDEDALHAEFNLVAGPYHHGGLSPGSLASVTDHGSVLMTETAFPYWQYSGEDEDKSEAIVRRYWGGAYGAPGRTLTVSKFVDARRASVAWLDWTDIHGWNVAQQRRVLFVKDRFFLVRDRFAFASAMRASYGQLWHAGDVRPEHGTNWFEVYDRQPVGNTWEFRNAERYALLYFVNRGYDMADFHESSFDPGPSCPQKPTEACESLTASYLKPADCRHAPPFVIYQRRNAEATAGEVRWFDTLIVPHDASQIGASAANVTVVYDDGTAVALEVKVPSGSAIETWTIVDNPDRKQIALPNLATDARFLVARREPGVPNYLLASEATNVRVGPSGEQARIEYAWGPVPNSVEYNGF